MPIQLSIRRKNTPKKLQPVAGGLSAANTTGWNNALLNATRRGASAWRAIAGIPSGCDRAPLVAGGVAALNYRLQAVTPSEYLPSTPEATLADALPEYADANDPPIGRRRSRSWRRRDSRW